MQATWALLFSILQELNISGQVSRLQKQWLLGKEGRLECWRFWIDTVNKDTISLTTIIEVIKPTLKENKMLLVLVG